MGRRRWHSWFVCVLALAVTSPAALAESPQMAGGVEPTNPGEIHAVSESVVEMVRDRKISGGIVLAAHKGTVIHFTAHGFRDVESKSPMERDTIVRIYSMTKPVTSVAVLMLMEDGLINLDDPVSQHLPELSDVRVRGFAGRRVKPKTPMTVEHLLTHTSGMTYGFFGVAPVDLLYMKDHPLFKPTNQEMVAKMGTLPLVSHPGTTWRYSMSTDVLGALVERVSGQTLGEFFQARLFGPLGMTDTGFVVPPSKVDRFASSYGLGLKLKERYADSEFLDPNRLQSGGGGLVSTASDYLRFATMLLNEGELDGQRYLKASTVKLMTTNRLPDGMRSHVAFGFGLGVRVQPKTWGVIAHEGQYGWDGVASTHFYNSPTDHLTVIALSQRQPFSMGLRHRVTPLIYEAIADREAAER